MKIYNLKIVPVLKCDLQCHGSVLEEKNENVRKCKSEECP
jgi:hypothetical protein